MDYYLSSSYLQPHNTVLLVSKRLITNYHVFFSERAETTQKELDRFTRDTSLTSHVSTHTMNSSRSASVVSAISDVSTGSDDVFLSSSAENREKDRKGINKDWEV